jgi:hypothetical protein
LLKVATIVRRYDVAGSFKEALETLVNERIAQGEDPRDLFEELSREANLVFGHYNLEYELGLTKKEAGEG